MTESRGDAAALDERYGRRGVRRGPWITVIAGALLAVAAIAWFVWARPLGGAATIESTDLRFSVESDASATLTWRLAVPAGTEVACAINAVNTAKAIVGWRVVRIPASAESIRDLTESLRTAEVAADVFVYRCWLA